jgi:pyruvate/2-oxoglutarate dehydrogenase complex dihydrolipoamide dehydrogenase (E3) component
VRARKRAMVAEWHDPKERRLQSTEHLDLIYGEAHFTGPHEIDVTLRDGGTRHLTSERIFLNTGSRPARPTLPGLDTIAPQRVLDSTSIMELGDLPEHLIVLGGGYVGLEFGQMFRRFGSRVTIVQRGPQLLRQEDHDVAEIVATVLQEDGIEILLEANAVRTTPSHAGVTLTVRQKSAERTIEGSHLLLATGRVPNSDALNLSAAAIETNRAGFITVNDRLETNVPGVWAVGDVKGGPAFTHISFHDSTIVLENVLRDGHASIAGRLVPYVVYIDPQLGRVGLSESEARASGRPIKVARMNMEDSSRASEVSETRGFMKVIVDAETSQILGCAVLGIEGGEIMSMLEIAMLGKLPYTALRDGVFAHPTLAESLNSLFYSID